MDSSSTPGKQQSLQASLKDIVTSVGKPNSNFSGKNQDLPAMEASSSDAVNNVAATSTTPNQGGKPSSVSSPHQQQQPMSASMTVKHEVKQQIDGTPAAPSFTPSWHNSISSFANTPAEVRNKLNNYRMAQNFDRENIDEFDKSLSICQHFPHQNFLLIIFCCLPASPLFCTGRYR